jgi:hypothetical protein
LIKSQNMFRIEKDVFFSSNHLQRVLSDNTRLHVSACDY